MVHKILIKLIITWIFILACGITLYGQDMYIKQNKTLVRLDTIELDYILVITSIAQGMPINVLLDDRGQLPYKIYSKTGVKVKARIGTALQLFEKNWKRIDIQFQNNNYYIIYQRTYDEK